MTQNYTSLSWLAYPTMHFLTRRLTAPFESRQRLILYANLMIAWLAITLFGTTISWFACVLITV